MNHSRGGEVDHSHICLWIIFISIRVNNVAIPDFLKESVPTLTSFFAKVLFSSVKEFNMTNENQLSH